MKMEILPAASQHLQATPGQETNLLFYSAVSSIFCGFYDEKWKFSHKFEKALTNKFLDV
jgi:hypothetical protein